MQVEDAPVPSSKNKGQVVKTAIDPRVRQARQLAAQAALREEQRRAALVRSKSSGTEPLMATETTVPAGSAAAAAAAAAASSSSAAAAAAAAPRSAAPASNVGNRKRDRAFNELLRLFAKSDFKHDFGEKDTGRDWITTADRQRFQEMLQKFSVKERVAYLNAFDALMRSYPDGVNIYQLLAGDIANQLYPARETGQDDKPDTDEATVLKHIGVDFEGAVKNNIKEHFNIGRPGPVVDAPSDHTYSTGSAGFPGIPAPPVSRNYRVRAQRYKNRDGSTRNLSSLFMDVTGGAKKFAILVDAATGLSLSSIRDATLGPAPREQCSFAVLENIEGDADSATGVSDIREKTTPGGPPAPVFSMYRDVDTSTSVFPIWQTTTAAQSPAEAENLFTKIKVILNRVEKGEVEASVILGEGSVVTIPDVGTASNVKNASLNSIAARFAADILRAAGKAAQGNAEAQKQYIYALLKRMGDWCQALSLLDRTRVYTVVDPKTGKPVVDASGNAVKNTLQGLISDGYEVGLVTNDRILLAYAIFLGLNVYYTTASDVGCLAYFKNQDDLPDEASVAARAQEILNTVLIPLSMSFFSGATPPTTSDEFVARLDSLKAGLEAAAAITLPDISSVAGTVEGKLNAGLSRTPTGLSRTPALAKAFAAKVYYANIGQLRTNFDELKTQFEVAKGYMRSTNPKDRLDGVTNLVNIIAKFKADIEHNREVLARLAGGQYDGTHAVDESIFVDLAAKMAVSGRITGSELMSRAKDVLLSIRDDIKQVKQKKGLTLPAGILPTPSSPYARTGLTDKDITNLDALYAAFAAVAATNQMTGGGSQVGGGYAVKDFAAILQRQVFPYRSQKLETAVKNLEIASATNESAKKILDMLDNLPAAQVGSFYRDEKNRPYTVVDSCLLTKEDLPALSILVEKRAEGELSEKVYVAARYALLYNDILYADYERMMEEQGLIVYRDTSKPYEGPTPEKRAELTDTFWEEAARLSLLTDALHTNVNSMLNNANALRRIEAARTQPVESSAAAAAAAAAADAASRSLDNALQAIHTMRTTDTPTVSSTATGPTTRGGTGIIGLVQALANVQTDILRFLAKGYVVPVFIGDVDKDGNDVPVNNEAITSGIETTGSLQPAATAQANAANGSSSGIFSGRGGRRGLYARLR